MLSSAPIHNMYSHPGLRPIVILLIHILHFILNDKFSYSAIDKSADIYIIIYINRGFLYFQINDHAKSKGGLKFW